MKAIVFVLLALPSLALAHGGGLDSNGGHFNRKTGVYHCHREPCFSNQRGEAQPKPKPAKAKRPAKATPPSDEPETDHGAGADVKR